MKAEIARTAMSARERAVRSQAAQLVTGVGLLRATLVERRQICGKPSCRCSRGQKHRCVYLTVSRQGRLEQLYVPKALEATVRRWVEQRRSLEELLEELFELHWQKVRRRKKEG